MTQTLDTEAQAIIDNIPAYRFPAAPAFLYDMMVLTDNDVVNDYDFFHSVLTRCQTQYDEDRQRVIELSTQE